MSRKIMLNGVLAIRPAGEWKEIVKDERGNELLFMNEAAAKEWLKLRGVTDIELKSYEFVDWMWV